jgi:hypothetical protein
MDVRRATWLVLLAAALGGPFRAAQAQTPPSVPAGPSGSHLDDLLERQGPFVFAGRAFTVEKRYKRLPGRTDPDAQTLVSLEILDASGRVQYAKSLAYSLEGGSFSETCAADVENLDGSNGKGFLIESDCLPSAPLSGGPWEVLASVNDRIVPMGKPLVTEGEFGGFVPGAVTHAGPITRVLPDTINIRVWTGYFFATVPVRVDWMQRRLVPAQRCFYQSGQGLKEEGCEFPAPEVERAPVDQDLTFVRLFPESRESIGVPAHIVVKRDSIVEVLAGKALVRWEDLPDVVNLGVDDDIWLKVRIDGKEGWIHTQEDLNALGLQGSG